jgi:hypothetical protein
MGFIEKDRESEFSRAPHDALHGVGVAAETFEGGGREARIAASVLGVVPRGYPVSAAASRMAARAAGRIVFPARKRQTVLRE